MLILLVCTNIWHCAH